MTHLHGLRGNLVNIPRLELRCIIKSFHVVGIETIIQVGIRFRIIRLENNKMKGIGEMRINLGLGEKPNQIDNSSE